MVRAGVEGSGGRSEEELAKEVDEGAEGRGRGRAEGEEGKERRRRGVGGSGQAEQRTEKTELGRRMEDGGGYEVDDSREQVEDGRDEVALTDVEGGLAPV